MKFMLIKVSGPTYFRLLSRNPVKEIKNLQVDISNLLLLIVKDHSFPAPSTITSTLYYIIVNCVSLFQTKCGIMGKI